VPDKPLCLNLGCGSTYHSKWRNLDIDPIDKNIEHWDAKNGIPALNNSVDIVYHSHLLEHLQPEHGEAFINECFRILKPMGILRVVVPDLEQICKEYLNALERVDQNIELAIYDAHWMRLELFDQMTRLSSGGEMYKNLLAKPPNQKFIIDRCGEQVRPLLESENKKQIHSLKAERLPLHLNLKNLLRKLTNFSTIKDVISRIFLGNSDYKALEYGRFFLCGEIHKHMYDRISLEELIVKIGFNNVIVQSHSSSLFPNWSNYCLDSTDNGYPKKPDSLYMEAIKSK
jgi:SAM-dependent methyltransferase